MRDAAKDWLRVQEEAPRENKVESGEMHTRVVEMCTQKRKPVCREGSGLRKEEEEEQGQDDG